MHHLDLLAPGLLACLRVKESDCAWLLAAERANATEVQVNGAVVALNSVLHKKTDFDVFFFEELK